MYANYADPDQTPHFVASDLGLLFLPMSHKKGCWEVIFIYIQILIEYSVCKQWRPWSDAAFCGIWSGSALFAYVLQKEC